MSTREEQTLLALMDFLWFEHGVFSTKPPPPPPEKSKLTRVATKMRKSHSDQFLSSRDHCLSDKDSSPTSVLTTILSGKETEDFIFTNESVKTERVELKKVSVDVKMNKKKKKKSSSSKSLSELEFEELKGFMDLGFVFSDQDKDSKKLVSIIPGLQRLGKEQEVEEKCEEPFVSRPYLSEAWDRFEEEERKRNLKMKTKKIDLRIPEFGNEMELKNHLRFWAHSVASAVR